MTAVNTLRIAPAPMYIQRETDVSVTLYMSAGYRIDYFPASTDAIAVAITFTSRTNRLLDGLGFGDGCMLKHGCALIAVKGYNDLWYQDFPDEALQAITAFLDNSRLGALPRATYGCSMGAYAAVVFAGPLKADALAISPLSDIKQPWDQRWRDDVPEFRPLSWNGHQSRVVIAYDPHDPDGKHAKALSSVYPDIVHIHVPFVGHPVAEEMHSVGCLKPLALAVIRGEPLPDIAPILKAKKKQGRHFVFVLALHCRDRSKFRWADSLIKAAVKLEPLNAEYRIVASSLAALHGRKAEAIEHAALAACLDPQHHSMQFYLAELLQQAGHPKGALSFAKRALALKPDATISIEQCRVLEAMV